MNIITKIATTATAAIIGIIKFFFGLALEADGMLLELTWLGAGIGPAGVPPGATFPGPGCGGVPGICGVGFGVTGEFGSII